MKWTTALLGIGAAVTAALLIAQETTTYSKKTTTQNPDGSTTSVTVTGEVVHYEPGHTIVIRQPNSKVVTYTLGTDLTVPAEVQVGRRVTIYTEPGQAMHVTRITTVTTSSAGASGETGSSKRTQSSSSSSAYPSTQSTTTTRESTETRTQPSDMPASSNQQTQQTTQTQMTPSGETTTSTTKSTTVYGTVTAFDAGKSITIAGPNHKTTIYTITTESQLPEDVAVGKRVTIRTSTVSGKPVVQTVTYRTRTRTTRTRSVSPQ